jgi:hypothetical protein
MGRRVMLAVILATAAAPASADAWTPPQTVAAKGGVPQLGADAAGNALLTWGRFPTATGSLLASSRAPGGGFAAPATVARGKDLRHRDLAVAAGGDAVLAWMEGGSIVVAIRPAGQAFGAPVTLPSQAADFPRVAISPRGDALVVWSQGGGEVHAAVRPAGGAFGAPETIGPGRTPVAALDTNGDALVAFEDGGEVHVAPRPAGGAFAGPTTLGSGQQPSVAFDATGGALVAWEDGQRVIAARGSLGAGFAAPAILSAQPAEAPIAALDDAGDAIVAWALHDSNEGAGRFRERIQVATAGPGAPFGAATDVSRVPRGGATVGAAHLAMNARGDAVVAWWQHATEAVGGPGHEDQVVTAVRAAGAAFGAPEPVSDPCVPATENLATAIDGSGGALAAWWSAAAVGLNPNGESRSVNRGLQASTRPPGPAAPGATAGPACGGGARSAAPRLAVGVPRGQGLARILRRGLRLTVRVSGRGMIAAQLRVDEGSANRVGIVPTIGRASRRATRAGRFTVIVRTPLNAALRTRLLHANPKLSVRVTVTGATGARRTVTRVVRS